MRERAVALGVDLDEAHRAGGLHDRLTAVHAHHLRGDAHPGVTAAHHLAVEERPVGGTVDPAAHVQPLDDDGAVEAGRVGGAVDEDARAVVGGAGRLGRAVAPELVRLGGTRQEVLGLCVAVLGEARRDAADEGAVAPGDGSFDRWEES